ncbi:sulfatase family protein [Saccharicrinis sp. 156]|uniref:sulfatase family protein n=1 Tax=Saccharicrinis sp. 156 TaxID=3417574 RepID=UPI003D32DCAB
MNNKDMKLKQKVKSSLRCIIILFCCVNYIGLMAQENPNVVFIFVDDLGYGDVGCYGATKVQTPNIDKLASEGMMFTDAHSASAVCTPSRYALLTGQYPLRAKNGYGTWGPLPTDASLIIDTTQNTIGKVFKNKNYATACIGKWHLGFGLEKNDFSKPLKIGPLAVGFDYYFGVPNVNSGSPYVYVENDRIVGWDPKDPIVYNGQPVSPTPTFPEEAGRKTPNKFSGALEAHKLYDDERTGTLLTEKAVKWIDKNKEKPFFLYFSTTNVHHPYTPNPKFKGTSQCGLYGDFIHELDWMVGELMKYLEVNNLRDNTLVVFTSDNGGMLNEASKIALEAGHYKNGDLLGYKFGAWEGGHRVPFIARWPEKIKANSVSDELICNVDMLSTFAALTAQQLEDNNVMDGINILPALLDVEAELDRDHLILAPRQGKNLAVRKGKWMYIDAQGSGGFSYNKKNPHAIGGPYAVTLSGKENSDIENGKIKQNAPPAQLYNLEEDVEQTTNLYKLYPKVVEEMKAILDTYMTKAERNQRRR